MTDERRRLDREGPRGTCIIMAGGRGTRFWPLSRSRRPKQLLPLGASSSLLRDTWERVEPVFGRDRILVITNADQADGVAAALPELAPDRVVAEPVGRNTAACCVLGALLAARLDGDGPVAFLPADHVVPDVDEFRRQMTQALAIAAAGDRVVTFGVTPTHPATGYGYLSLGRESGEGPLAGLDFVEKPDLETARGYVEGGRHLWNSGMFVWPAAAFRAAAEAHVPRVAATIAPAAEAWGGGGFAAALDEAYRDCPSVSVDVGVMEKLDGFLVLRAAFRWSDLGSWDAWGAQAPELPGGNRGLAAVLAVDSRDNTVYSPDRLVALLGVDDLVVVDTPDAILVTRSEEAQRLREVLDAVEDLGREDLL